METLIAGPHKGAIRAPRGTRLSTKGWQQEAALRMLMNNLDPEVAEAPEELVVYGGTGKAARNWPCFYAIVRALESLENDETLLIQSGKPVGILRTHTMAPAGADRQLQPGRQMVELGSVSRTGAKGIDDVWPDDGRFLDLHRKPGHRARHLRDLCRSRAASILAAAWKGS